MSRKMAIEPASGFVGDPPGRIEPGRQVSRAGKQQQFGVVGSRFVQSATVVRRDHPILLAVDDQDGCRGTLQRLAGVSEIGIEVSLSSRGIDTRLEGVIGDERPDSGQHSPPEVGDDIAQRAEGGDRDDTVDPRIATGEVNGGCGSVRDPQHAQAASDQPPGLEGVNHSHQILRFTQTVGHEPPIRLSMSAEIDQHSAVSV